MKVGKDPRSGLSLLLGAGSGLLLLGLQHWDPLVWSDHGLQSQFFSWRGPQPPHPDVVILAIDDSSQNLEDLFTAAEIADNPRLAQMTRWPWPREVFAAALDQLGAAGARVVAFDLIFDQPSVYGPEDDQRFAAAIATHRQRTLFGVSRSEDVQVLPGGSRSVRVAFTPLWQDYADAEPQLGLVNLPISPNRQVMMLPAVGGEVDGRTGLAIRPLSVVASSRLLPNAVDEAGDLSWGIQYRGPRGTYPTYPFWHLFEPTFWQLNLGGGEVFRDKIVLIGDTTQLGQDLWNTPLDPLLPGVEIHANAIGTLLAGDGIRTVSWAWGSLLILGAGLGIGLGLMLARGVLPKLGLTVAGVGIALAGSYLAFDLGWRLPTTAMILAGSLAGLADTTWQGMAERRDRLRLRRILERRVAPAVLDEILQQPNSFAETLGGQLRPVAILFSDIRGFTPLAADMDPQDLVTLLNRYFAAMVEPILAEQGTIDKFIGDAIMAEFGTPLFRDPATEALAAIRAAVGMRAALRQLQEQLKLEGKPLFEHGVGIHFGSVVAGNLGSPQRLEYTVIGDAVNVAARIESLTKEVGWDILISETVYELVRDQVQVQVLGSHLLKGKVDPIQIYGVEDLISVMPVTSAVTHSKKKIANIYSNPN
ncbi:MAG: adenylate/guanylate cyclase domain-containing protein [Synechococcaceae cyanobacterium SM2_3_2]|nr:adenylate/guanylate cyclase domain-containing protein [Synechococcaceae cyanobacterium SM2_3_2]